MKVNFREIDPFNSWIWIRFANVPGQGEKNYIDGVFDSWYVIGRLGGFNSANLQAHDYGSDLSWMSYENAESGSVLPSLMHNIGQLEYQGDWARCWVDLGTCDALAIDVLINSLKQVDVDIVELNEVVIGGVNDDWPVEDHPDSIFPSQGERRV
ncbi:DUF3531 family protein [Prochlorococcus sp. MIT 1223]|uniref:DUF3531 family protein n=1 Tax=Prochlorococcus sp. MIT 1223 TaxID=3096217 RepID=UPI002A75D55A|nr:DUF3531 family protein [Prochlorococcus sp. MIT 1223]